MGAMQDELHASMRGYQGAAVAPNDILYPNISNIGAYDLGRPY
jgi:hypothetical protein